MDLDAKLCYCFHISKRKIVNYVKQTRPKRASQISDCFGAGTGCGWCIPFLKRIHCQIVAGNIVEADDMTAEEYEAMRASYRQGVSAGTHTKNSHATDTIPPELAGRFDDFESTEGSDPGSPDSTATSDTAEDDSVQGDDWDVSDYFSRSRPPEPEPDTLE